MNPNLTSSRPLVLSLLAAALGRAESEIDVDRPILELGLDSVAAVTLTVQLEERLGIAVEPTVILEHETVTLLSAYLDAQQPASAGAPR